MVASRRSGDRAAFECDAVCLAARRWPLRAPETKEAGANGPGLLIRKLKTPSNARLSMAEPCDRQTASMAAAIVVLITEVLVVAPLAVVVFINVVPVDDDTAVDAAAKQLAYGRAAGPG